MESGNGQQGSCGCRVSGSRLMIALGIGAVLAVVAAVVIMRGRPEQKRDRTVHCYVGGTMRPAMEKLADMFTKQTGIKVDVDYGESGTNMIKAEQTRKGDLYVAHDPFHGGMDAKGLVADAWHMATISPVIVVQKGNPKNIKGLADLMRDDVKGILTDWEYTTVGHICRAMFNKAGINIDELEKKIVANRPRSGGEAANAVALGNADMSVVWDAVAFLRADKLDVLPVEPQHKLAPGADAVTSATFGPIDMSEIRVTMDLLKSSEDVESARKFAEFCASPENQAVWKAQGFGLPSGGPARIGAKAGPAPAAQVEPLLLYAGGGLQPAIEDAAAAFEAAEHIKIDCDFGGSGEILARLKLSNRGDLFMPGDKFYIDEAGNAGMVESSATACYFTPVILVQKGNPRGIKSLADLTAEGLELGLGDPEACQIGRSSVELFKKNNIDQDAIHKNVRYSAPTVNALGLQMQAGHLDAVIVWNATAAYYADQNEVVAIPPERNVTSQVDIALLKCSKRPDLAKRFIAYITGPAGREIFKKHQYTTEKP